MYLKISERSSSCAMWGIWILLLLILAGLVYVLADDYIAPLAVLGVPAFGLLAHLLMEKTYNRVSHQTPLLGLEFEKHNLTFVTDRPISIAYDKLSVVMTIHIYNDPVTDDDGYVRGYRPGIHYFQFDFNMQDKTLLPVSTANYQSSEMNLIFELLHLAPRFKQFSHVLTIDEKATPALQKYMTFLEKQISSYLTKGTYTTERDKAAIPIVIFLVLMWVMVCIVCYDFLAEVWKMFALVTLGFLVPLLINPLNRHVK